MGPAGTCLSITELCNTLNQSVALPSWEGAQNGALRPQGEDLSSWEHYRPLPLGTRIITQPQSCQPKTPAEEEGRSYLVLMDPRSEHGG